VGNSPLSGSDPLGLCGDDAPDADVQAEIEHVRGGYRAFWGGVRQVGNALHGGIEFAAAFNPVTSVGIGFNKLGEGNYGQAAFFFLPAFSALGGEGEEAADVAQNLGARPKIGDLIPTEVRDAAGRAFRNNTLLSEMTAEDRAAAAEAYETMAASTVGSRAEAAALYNLERAKFLRGEVDRIAPSLPDFIQERGLPLR
jgi:hypothetical protein